MFAGTPGLKLMMNSASCLPVQQRQLTLTGQSTFPAPARPGLVGSGRIAAHSEITLDRCLR